MSFFIFLLGLIVGSFLNVCIYRIPRRLSIIFPFSYCPCCEKRLVWSDLIPLLSFILLRGRCRYCAMPIPWRYPVVEMLSGLVFLSLFRLYGFDPMLLQLLVLTCILIVVTFTDLEHMFIPDRVIVFGLLSGLVLKLITGHSLVDAIFGMMLGGGIILSISFLSNGGMGGGDIKLGILIGLFLGWRLVLPALFGATLGAALVGVVLMIFGLKHRKDLIPFGPFMALGTMISIIWGPTLIEWYFSCFLR